MTHSFRVHLKRLGFATYREYLTSDHWRDVKARYAASDLPKFCIGCSAPYQVLHHRTYTRLGKEMLLDFVPLCHGCHEKIHEFEKVNPTKIQQCHKMLRSIFGWSKEETRRRFAPISNPNRAGGLGWCPRDYDEA